MLNRHVRGVQRTSLWTPIGFGFGDKTVLAAVAVASRDPGAVMWVCFSVCPLTPFQNFVFAEGSVPSVRAEAEYTAGSVRNTSPVLSTRIQLNYSSIVHYIQLVTRVLVGFAIRSFVILVTGAEIVQASVQVCASAIVQAGI